MFLTVFFSVNIFTSCYNSKSLSTYLEDVSVRVVLFLQVLVLIVADLLIVLVVVAVVFVAVVAVVLVHQEKEVLVAVEVVEAVEPEFSLQVLLEACQTYVEACHESCA